jgi:hypothetical protein
MIVHPIWEIIGEGCTDHQDAKAKYLLLVVVELSASVVRKLHESDDSMTLGYSKVQAVS